MLVDKYKGSVYGLAYAKLGNFHDAQDITQEVFLKAFRKLRTLKRWDKFLSWLYAITSNLCKDFLRSKASRPDEEFVADQEIERLDNISIDSHHEDQIHQTLREALSELPEVHRQVLSLHYLGGLSCKEIAQFLGVSPHAIAMRLNRARAKLRKEMLTMMHTSFDGQKLHSGFTLNIVEMIRRTHIQPNPQAPVIPIGIAVVGLLTISMLSLFTPFNQLPAIGKLIGAPIPSETKVMDVGEIPVDVVMLPNTSVVSSGDGKKDSIKNSRQTNKVYAANPDTEVETSGRNEPTARLGNGAISEVIYSPDGELIAAAGSIGIWLYDAETLTEIGLMRRGATTIAFSPDGQTLASGRWDDGTVHLWNVSTREQIGNLRWPGLPQEVAAMIDVDGGIILGSDRGRGVASIAFTPDGQTLAVAHVNGKVDFWYVQDRILITTLTCGEGTKTLAFSPDGGLLASGGSERTIKVWDVQSPGNRQPAPTAVRYFEEHDMREHRLKVIVDDVVSSMAFSPDGKTLVSARAGKVPASLWDVATQTKITQLIDYGDEKGFPSIVAFSPDGAIIVTAGDSGQIRLWDAQTQRQIGMLKTDAGGVSSMAFHPNGKTLASLNSRYIARNAYKTGDMVIRLWDVERHTLIAAAQHHKASVESVSLSADGTLLASGHQDGSVTFWDMQSAEQTGVLRGNDAMVECVALDRDGKILATSAKNQVRLWDVLKRKQTAVFEHFADVRSLAFSRDGKILACADDTCIRLWDTWRKKEVAVLGQADLVAPYSYSMQWLAFSPDGESLASGGVDKKFRLWDVAKREEIFTQLTGDIFAVASGFGPNGEILAAAATRKEIHLWNVTEHKLIWTLKVEDFVKTLAFSPSGRFLAAGDGTKIRVWDMKTQVEAATLEVGALFVSSLVFSSDGNTLVAGSWDGVIRVWDTSGLGNE